MAGFGYITHSGKLTLPAQRGVVYSCELWGLRRESAELGDGRAVFAITLENKGEASERIRVIKKRAKHG